MKRKMKMSRILFLNACGMFSVFIFGFVECVEIMEKNIHGNSVQKVG